MENLLKSAYGFGSTVPGTPLRVRTNPMIIHARVPNGFMCFPWQRRKRGDTHLARRPGPRRYARPVWLCGDWTPKLPPQERRRRAVMRHSQYARPCIFGWLGPRISSARTRRPSCSIDTWRSWSQGGRESMASSMRRTLPAINWRAGMRRRNGRDSLLRPGSSGGRSFE
jgi:hypothetical protein